MLCFISCIVYVMVLLLKIANPSAGTVIIRFDHMSLYQIYACRSLLIRLEVRTCRYRILCSNCLCPTAIF